MNRLFREMISSGKKMHQMNLNVIRSDFSHNEWMIMNTIYEMQEQKEPFQDEKNHPGAGCLAEMMQCSPPMISKILNALEKRDLIYRSMDTKDRRNTKIFLTQKGIQAVEKGRVIYEAYIDRVIERFGEDKIRQLISYMDEFYDISQDVIKKMEKAKKPE